MDTFQNRVEKLIEPLIHSQDLINGWTLEEYECEQGLTLTFAKNENIILVELEKANNSAPFYAQTRLFNIYYSKIYRHTDILSADEKKLLDFVISIIKQREHLIPLVQPPQVYRKVALREIKVQRLLKKEPGGSYYLNPYVGCLIGCPFCYAIHRVNFSREIEGLPLLQWGRFVDIKINAPEVLAEEIKKLRPGPVRISPIVTDPYQPIERKYRITQKCLSAMVNSGFTPFILTRAVRIFEDLDLLKKFKNIVIGFTIPTDNDKMRAIFEPGADPIDERIECIKQLRSNGIKIVLFIQPVMPMNPERLAEMVGPYISAVRIDRMYKKERVVETCKRYDIEYCLSDDYFNDIKGRLLECLKQYGVYHSEMDYLDEILKG